MPEDTPTQPHSCLRLRWACLVAIGCLLLASATGCVWKKATSPDRANAPLENEVAFAIEPQLPAADASKYLAVAVRQLETSGELDEAKAAGAHFGTMLRTHRWILASSYDSIGSAVGTETRGYFAPVLDAQGSFVGAVVIEPWSKDSPVGIATESYRCLAGLETRLQSTLGTDTEIRFITAPFGVTGFAVASSGGHVAFLHDVDLSTEGVPGRAIPGGAERGRLYKDQEALDALGRAAASFMSSRQCAPGAASVPTSN